MVFSLTLKFEKFGRLHNEQIHEIHLQVILPEVDLKSFVHILKKVRISHVHEELS